MNKYCLFVVLMLCLCRQLSAQTESKADEYIEREEGSINYERKIVVEEATATWCGWCIRGIVMMDRMEKKYPDKFILMSLHKGDVMSVDWYEENINSISRDISINSLPKAVLDRNVMCDPFEIEEKLLDCIDQDDIKVALEATAAYDRDLNIADISSRLHFEKKGIHTDYRLAYYLVEDSVYHPDDARYRQKNKYSGSSDDWDGYEYMGPVISDMYFRNVVRGFDWQFDGIPESVPESFDAETEIMHDYRFLIPESVDDIEKCHFVVMLIDMEDRHVINACTAPLETPSGIDAAVMYPVQEILIYGIDGRLVDRGSDIDSLLKDRKGMFIVKQGTKIRKIMV